MTNLNSQFLDILCDHPIDDASFFNFVEYIDSLTKIIVNPKNTPPFTIAINGDWGTGKTTLMRSIQSNLEQSKKNIELSDNSRLFKTVWFDAWKYCEKDSLLSALALEIYENVVKDQDPIFKSGVTKKIKKIFFKHPPNKGKIIEDFLKFSLASLSLVNGMPPLKYDELNVSNWIGSAIDKDKLSYYSKFNEYLDSIIELYLSDSKSDRRGTLVIFIDDLDRCPPHSVAEILEAINLFFDKGQCIFLIGMDIPKVSAMIEAFYEKYNVQISNNKNINPDDSFSGEEYLKKMVQIQLNLPRVHPQDLKDYIKSSYNESLPHIYDYDFVIDSLKETNLREIKRFFNTIILILEIKNSIKNKNELRLDIDDELLIKWQLIQFLFPEISKNIKKEPFLLLALDDYAKDEESNDFYNAEWMEIDYDLNNRYFEYFIEYTKNSQLMEILRSGNRPFEINSIEGCIFLFSFTQLISKKEGSITIVANGDGSYYLGDKILLSGTCTASNKVFLHLKGKNLPKNGVKLNEPSIECKSGDTWTFTTANVHSNSTWEYVLDTKAISKYLPVGDYTVYAVSEPYFNPITENKEFDTINILLKKPFIMGTIDSATLAIGSELIIRGIAEGNPNNIYIWIFGNNSMYYYPVDVHLDGSYEFTFKNNNINPGQYFILVQHPYLKERPNVFFENNQIKLKSKSENYQTEFIPSEALKIVMDLLNHQECDDIYAKLSFIVEEPSVSINEIGTHKKGDTISISGHTNLPVNSTLITDISVVSDLNNTANIIPFISKAVVVSKGETYNEWLIDIDTTYFKQGTYLFRINILELNKVFEEFFEIQ